MPDHPWRAIPSAESGSLQALRADASHPFDFFYAKNSEGNLLLTLGLHEAHDRTMDLPRLSGIDMRWTSAPNGLQIKLNANSDWEMFLLLCRDLIESTRSVSCEQQCVATLAERLMRWHRLLRKGGPRLMDENELRGLIAELLFLEQELMPRFGPAAVEWWKGPLGFPQDFAVGGNAFEVKSHLVGAPQSVRIASPEQLFVDDADLFLSVFHLAAEIDGGLHVCALVERLAKALASDVNALAAFQERLDNLGFVALPDYDKHCFLVQRVDHFMVRDGFPRLAPSDVPPGLVDVRYSIQLATLEPFRAELPLHAREV